MPQERCKYGEIDDFKNTVILTASSVFSKFAGSNIWEMLHMYNKGKSNCKDLERIK